MKIMTITIKLVDSYMGTEETDELVYEHTDISVAEMRDIIERATRDV